ncbi:cyclic GMP-AMP synthase-like [Saccostrea cucullata]|uniref:cyclic GMP-AMP synthase-like n=1 Tax=Saccostrea cuccullata TaxID=36930 RepID=UPI002ED06C97
MSRKHKQGDRHDHKEPRRITTTIEDNDNKHRPRPSSIEENDDKYRQRRSSIEENDDKLRRRPSSIEENYNKYRRRTSSVEENDDKLRRRTSSTGGKDESTEKSDGKPSPRSTVEDDRKFPTVKRMHNACCSHCGDADGGSTKSRLLENHISITSPSNSSLPFHVTNVTKYIAMLEGEIKIRKKDSASTRKGVNEFIESLNKAMDGISNIPLKMLNSGSHFDKTSIEYDDEFDFMVCPSGKFEAVFKNCPPGFCKLRKGRTTIDDLDQALNKDGYLVPEIFKQKMFSIFEDCITSPGFRQGRRIKRMPRKPESPAFTLQFDLGSGIPTVDIDLVPAIKIDSWPSTGRKICPEWIGTDNVQKAMKCFHVVTKTYPADHPDADILWRISFSHAEKELILHANQRDKGCRKDILKLLKKIKQIIKVQNPHQTDKFCSYHLKMFMLEFYDRHKDFCQEKKESLFKQSVKELMKCFSNGEIRNYFIPEDNILRFVSDNEKSLVTQELRKIQEKF